MTQPDQVDAVDVAVPCDGAKDDDACWLVEYLADRDAPCPLCGYNLRGLTSRRCPECGERLVLAVRQAEPYLRAWLALAAAICPCGGIGLFFLLILLVSGVGGSMDGGELLTFVGFIAAAVVMPFVFIFRRRYLRLARNVQILIAVWAWICGAGLYLLLFAMIQT